MYTKTITYFNPENNRPSIENIHPKGTISIERVLNYMCTIGSPFEKMLTEVRLGTFEKTSLPYFTFSGVFITRTDKDLDSDTYTFLAVLDIDKKDNPKTDMQKVKNKLSKLESTLFVATSPNLGLKALIQLKLNAYDYFNHYRVMKEIIYPHFEKLLNVKIDYAQGRLSQPFFATFDEFAYINYNCKQLDIDYTLKTITVNQPLSAISDKKDYIIDNYIIEIENLTEDKWQRIGAISLTLGGWAAAGYFNTSNDLIISQLKAACEKNKHIKNIKTAHKQIVNSFNNGVLKPIYMLEDDFLQNKVEIIDNNTEIENEITEIIEEDGEFDYSKHTFKEINNFHKYLQTAPIEDVIDYIGKPVDFSKTYIKRKYLLYPLIRENELSVVFGDTGHGKSVFTTQIANYIAKGSCDWDQNIFHVDTTPQKVLYIDFELGPEYVTERYNTDYISDNLIIVSVITNNYNRTLGTGVDKHFRVNKSLEIIETLSKKYDCKVVFIDNLSNISDEIEQASDADRFISTLKGRGESLNITYVCVAHTPKVNKFSPLDKNQLKGSSSLAKSFASIIGFKRSKEKNHSYIKQLKVRGGEYTFDEDSVAEFLFTNNGHYHLDFIGLTSEIDMLETEIKKGAGRPSLYTEKKKFEIYFDIDYKHFTIKKTVDKFGIGEATIYRIKKEIFNDPALLHKYEIYKKERISEEASGDTIERSFNSIF